MTPEAQRIAIAEACGGRIFTEDGVFFSFITKDGTSYGDPVADLNAMHEAASTLRPSQYLEFLGYLEQGVSRVPDMTIFSLVFATAAQRAEAFLKTLNLWTE